MGDWALWKKIEKLAMCIVDLAIWQTELGPQKIKCHPAKWYSVVVQRGAGRGEKVQKNHKDLHQS
jgi:hypothetical protein